jgi:starch synthase (maltosyl-transferring)
MSDIKGQARVVIENVLPQIDCGHWHYAAKYTVGEFVQVSADILGDGHDHIRAQVLFRHETSESWSTLELRQQFNDRWEASFQLSQKGFYLFTIRAWIDHFETWFDGFRKKAEAALDVHVELMEGAVLLKRIGKGDPFFQSLADTLSDKEQYRQAIEKILSPSFERTVHEHPLIEHETVFEHELKLWVEFRKANFSAWYELFPRSASLDGGHGTFNDVVRLLPRIASMGFDVLYLPPIHPIGKVNRKGSNNSVRALEGEPGSPWAVGSDEGGHKAIHPQLGTLETFRKLIAEAKRYDIDVAIDIAFQCAPDHPYVTDHPQWFKQRPDGSIQYAENPPKKYQDIYPFNFETGDWKNLWEELKSVFEYWIDQGVKIFRVDNPHTKPIRFWQWVIGEINKKHEDIIFLSEAFTRPKIMASLARVGFTQSYTYFTWRVSKEEIAEYMNELLYSPSRYYFRPNFWPNTPDILPFHLQHQGENIFIIRMALAATLSSCYGIYGPVFEFYDNQPLPGREEYKDSEKYEIRKHEWKKTNRMTDIITIINRVRKEHPALQSTWNLQFCTIQEPNLLAFLKATEDLSDIFLVVVNLDPNQRHSGFVQLPRQKLRLQGGINVKLHDMMTDEHYTWTQEWNYVELDPFKMPFHLFRLQIHESNM